MKNILKQKNYAHNASQSTSSVTSTFEIWMEFWSLNIASEISELLYKFL